MLIYECITSSGFKETAFLLAVSSAALSHALAKACSSGRMERCTCDDSPGLQHREAWQWGVCGDNLKYSTKFLKRFLGQKRVSKDLRAQIDAHNINVGIRVRRKILILKNNIMYALKYKVYKVFFRNDGFPVNHSQMNIFCLDLQKIQII